MKQYPNPQGKGLAPVLESILVSRNHTEIPAKHIEQIICELFTSQFVLQGKFAFCPVVSRSYWLYRKDTEYKLSMIAPQEWRHDGFGQFVAECVLQSDMTWTVQVSDQARSSEFFTRHIESLWEKFRQNITTPSQLKNALPVYDARLSFYPRVLASNLSYSLGVSLNKSIAGLDDPAIKATGLNSNFLSMNLLLKSTRFSQR